jgi:hypothetical protein
MGIIDDIVENPILIGGITLTAIVALYLTADLTKDTTEKAADLTTTVIEVIKAPFSFTGDKIDDFTSWADDALDSALISPTEWAGYASSFGKWLDRRRK